MAENYDPLIDIPVTTTTSTENAVLWQKITADRGETMSDRLRVLMDAWIADVGTTPEPPEPEPVMPVITTESLPPAKAGASYSAPVTATNGVLPYAWSASGLPSGYAINASTGVIAGVTTQTGVFPVTVIVTAADTPAEMYSYRNYELSVVAADQPVPPQPLPTGEKKTLFWIGIEPFVYKTDIVRKLFNNNVKAWSVVMGRLPGMGGDWSNQWWIGLPSSSGVGDLYLGVYASNVYAHRPWNNWKDEQAWQTTFASLKFAGKIIKDNRWRGFAIDSEPYDGGEEAWSIDDPSFGNMPEKDKRSLVRQRGRQCAEALGANIDVHTYYLNFPDTMAEEEQRVYNHTENAYDHLTLIDFWQGWGEYAQRGRIDFLEAKYYKTAKPANSWEEAMQYDRNAFNKIIRDRFGGSTAVGFNAFTWIDRGPGGDEPGSWPHEQSPGESTVVMDNARIYGDTFAAVYDYGGLVWNYDPYTRAFKGPQAKKAAPASATASVRKGTATARKR